MINEKQYYATIDEMEAVLNAIEYHGSKLIYVAGASASWKSFFNKKLQEALTAKGHRVLNISSDDYYTDLTNINFMLYGTFDHPHLIDYRGLQQDIDTLFEKGKVKLPQYSFKERRTVSYRHIDTFNYDYVLVEWLYTISQLWNAHNPFKIFVDSHIEELIFRRLVRDQERVSEPLHDIVSMLGKVFPLWKVYGDGQREKWDMIVFNDYNILDAKGESYTLKKVDYKKSELGTLQKREYVNEFLYDDTHPGNGVVVVSEVYRDKYGFLDGVIVSKKNRNGDPRKFTEISMRINQPWFLTVIHTLLQTAGLRYIGREKRVESTYKNGDKEVTIKERAGEMFEKVAEDMKR